MEGGEWEKRSGWAEKLKGSGGGSKALIVWLFEGQSQSGAMAICMDKVLIGNFLAVAFRLAGALGGAFSGYNACSPCPLPNFLPPLPCRPFCYFLMPSYWFPSRFVNNQLNRINDSMGPSVNPGSVDSDVAEEEAKMRTLLHHRTGGGQ